MHIDRPQLIEIKGHVPALTGPHSLLGGLLGLGGSFARTLARATRAKVRIPASDTASLNVATPGATKLPSTVRAFAGRGRVSGCGARWCGNRWWWWTQRFGTQTLDAIPLGGLGVSGFLALPLGGLGVSDFIALPLCGHFAGFGLLLGVLLGLLRLLGFLALDPAPCVLPLRTDRCPQRWLCCRRWPIRLTLSGPWWMI